MGTKSRGLKVDLKLDLHPSLCQKSLASLLMLNNTALQARAQMLVDARCIPTYALHSAPIFAENLSLQCTAGRMDAFGAHDPTSVILQAFQQAQGYGTRQQNSCSTCRHLCHEHEHLHFGFMCGNKKQHQWHLCIIRSRNRRTFPRSHKLEELHATPHRGVPVIC